MSSMASIIPLISISIRTLLGRRPGRSSSAVGVQ
jgi:hypothetical protein